MNDIITRRKRKRETFEECMAFRRKTTYAIMKQYDERVMNKQEGK
jgi:hypothetical protein